MAKKRGRKRKCPVGSHRKGGRCVRTRAYRTGKAKRCPSMKALGRQWRSMSAAAKNRFKKRGRKSSWNVFVAFKRRGCGIRRSR